MSRLKVSGDSVDSKLQLGVWHFCSPYTLSSGGLIALFSATGDRGKVQSFTVLVRSAS